MTVKPIGKGHRSERGRSLDCSLSARRCRICRWHSARWMLRPHAPSCLRRSKRLARPSDHQLGQWVGFVLELAEPNTVTMKTAIHQSPTIIHGRSTRGDDCENLDRVMRLPFTVIDPTQRRSKLAACSSRRCSSRSQGWWSTPRRVHPRPSPMK